MKSSAKSVKTISLIFFCAVAAVMLTLCASAAEKLTSTVGLLNPRENITGEGYKWMNRYDTLYLNGLNVDTEDDYGLKIADGAKVVLQGENYIKASIAAIYLGGNVTFTGTGSLTLVGGETGILTMTTNNEKTLRISSGSYDISAGKYGINSYYSRVSLAGGSLEISISDRTDGFAIVSPNTVIGDGTVIKTNGTVRGADNLRISHANLEISSEKEALSGDGYTVIENVGIKAGDSEASLEIAEEYGGQKCIYMVSTFVKKTESIIFGEGCPIWVDIVILAAVVVILAASIAVPVIIKKRRTLKKAAAFEAEAALMPKNARKKRYTGK